MERYKQRKREHILTKIGKKMFNNFRIIKVSKTSIEGNGQLLKKVLINVCISNGRSWSRIQVTVDCLA